MTRVACRPRAPAARDPLDHRTATPATHGATTRHAAGMNRTRTAALLSTVALLAALAACSSDSDSDDEAGGTPNSGGDGSLEEPGDEPPAVIELGATHDYGDGAAITVEIAELFAPNDYANFGDDQQYALLEATFANNTGAPVEIGYATQDCVVDGENVPHELFLDITSEWPAVVQDGAEGTWRYACLVDGAIDLQAQMQINDYPAVYFTGAVPQ